MNRSVQHFVSLAFCTAVCGLSAGALAQSAAAPGSTTDGVYQPAADATDGRPVAALPPAAGSINAVRGLYDTIRGQDYGPREGVSAPAGAVVINPGDDLRQVLLDSPAGTTFFVRRGLYRVDDTIVLDDDDVLIGEAGAVVSGAKVLDGAEVRTVDGRRYHVFESQTQQAPIGAPQRHCTSSSPACHRPEQFFLGGVQYRQVAALGELRSGRFFLDYPNDRIVLTDDPSGRLAEASHFLYLVRFGRNVTIRNMTFEKVSGGGQQTSVGGYRRATAVTMQNNGFRQLGGGAASLPDDSVFTGNRVEQAGQIGLHASRQSNLRIENNLFEGNNVDGWAWQWEAGATKFSAVSGLVARGNWFLANEGAGFWSDTNNVDHTVEANLSEFNLGTGLFYENSWNGTIRGNLVYANRELGIHISNSHDVTVTGNELDDNRSAIALRNVCRGNRNWYLGNVEVSGNWIRQVGYGGPNSEWPRGKAVRFDVADSIAACDDYDTLFESFYYGSGTRMFGNRYFLVDDGSGTVGDFWHDDGTGAQRKRELDFSTWQALGQDSGSVMMVQ